MTRKELYFQLMDYLWDLKESTERVVVNVRMLHKDNREPIDIFIDGKETFYLDVTDEDYVLTEHDGQYEIDFDDLKERIAECLK